MSHLTDQAHVSLHPLASRHGTTSSTLVSVNAPSTNPRHYHQSRDQLADRDDGQGTPRLQRSFPASPWTRPSQQRSPSPKSLPSAAPSLQSEPPSYGIRHDDIDDYPVIYDEALPSDSISEDEDEDDEDDDDTFDDAPYTSQRTGNTQSARRPHLLKRQLAAPIRAMSADQLAQLHEQYVAQDVPHHVVFPFLHGVDGSIPAQNYFFGAPLSGQPAPAYRGLTIMRADMPSRQEMEQLCATSNTHSSGRSRARTFSSVTTQSSSSSPDTDDESARFEPSWTNTSHNASPFGLAASTAADPTAFTAGSTAPASPSTVSTVSSEASRPSLFSSESYSSGSRTSVSTASDIGDDCARASAKLTPSIGLIEEFEKQPRRSILNSTVFPTEVIKPPTIRRTMYGRHVYDDLSEACFGDDGDGNQARRVAPSFINPPQASGVSLRNFKIQCAKYATISDIVIYCPFGYHSGVLTLAKWVREAQASLRKERLSRGWGGLQYNVFVVTEPFRVFEERFPSMVSVDSNGYDRNRIDFVDREREEMERMTQATEIHDNVWLGCSADAPGVPKKAAWEEDGGEDSAPITPDEQANPRCFSVCINCEEDRSLASSTCSSEALRNAAKYLDSVDASARIDIDTDKILESLHRDQLFGGMDGGIAYEGFRSANSRDGSIVLGPNGWVPKPRSLPVHADAPGSQFAQSQLSNTGSAHCKDVRGRGLLRLDASSIVHLDFQTGSGGVPRTQGWQDKMAKKLVDVCAWISQQASPSAVEQPVRDAPIFSSLSSTLRSFRDGARSPTRSFSPNHGREHTSNVRDERCRPATRRPRRVLLHCPDGYTETSVLALSYLMYARELSLPEAYLDLQLRANRSFFVYPADVAVLEAVERLLQYTRAARRQSLPEPMDVSGDTRRTRHAASKSFSGAVMLDGRKSDNRRMSLSATAATADSGKLAMPGSLSPADGVNGICRSSTPTPTKCRANVVPVDASELVEKHEWFSKSKFDGSFPSRILPFLYLGNLDHASNVEMLRVLGITHLVSVGETALQPPAHISAKVNPPRSKDHSRSRYQRASAKAALAEDPLTVPSCTYQSQGVTVLNVRNVSDDGIDSLRGTMREAVQFIEEARLSGGKVLVHCRVGVSRSTTIVLAYVMAHLDLGLVESYLLVRSRRLNIVIQPHLLFLWELRGWETFLHRAKQAQVQLLRARRGSRDLTRGELSRETSRALSALSIRSSSARSEEDSGSYRSATSSLAGSPVAKSMVTMANAAAAPGAQQWNDECLHGVEIGAGAGSIHGFDMTHSATSPFGSGSPTGIPYSASRLTWGHLAREIADLNSRYFV